MKVTVLGVGAWGTALAKLLHENGHHLTLWAHRADRLDEIIDHLRPRVGALSVCPIWPKRERNANRVIVQGRRDAKAGLSLLPGIVVRNQDDSDAREMEDSQRHGGGLSLSPRHPKFCAQVPWF